MQYMAKETLTFRVESKTRDALDALADALDRDRSYVINEALHAFIETHNWQLAHIGEGLRQAEAGNFVPDAQVNRVLNRLRRR
jgi:RHH-type transcriptional regulator, rel operon repressor / antitoxin RelB